MNLHSKRNEAQVQTDPLLSLLEELGGTIQQQAKLTKT
jgi:hypothetical protein